MTVFMCSGQGAQKPGMGADLLDIPEVAQVFETASRVLDCNLTQLVTSGSASEINDAFNAQALTCAVSIGVGRALIAHGVKPSAVLGFSLGQISALALTEALDLESSFALLKVRAQAMARACVTHPGAMYALLGASNEEAQALCETCAQGRILVMANYNCPGQRVISGEPEAIERAAATWSSKPKGRGTRLNTAGGFHSPLMAEAAIEVRNFCENLNFKNPKIPLLCNTDALPFCAEEAAQRLSKQIVSPVLFEQSVTKLIEAGECEFIETGFGGTLVGLTKRIDRSVSCAKAGTRKELEVLYA